MRSTALVQGLLSTLEALKQGADFSLKHPNIHALSPHRESNGRVRGPRHRPVPEPVRCISLRVPGRHRHPPHRYRKMPRRARRAVLPARRACRGTDDSSRGCTTVAAATTGRRENYLSDGPLMLMNVCESPRLTRRVIVALLSRPFTMSLNWDRDLMSICVPLTIADRMMSPARTSLRVLPFLTSSTIRPCWMSSAFFCSIFVRMSFILKYRFLFFYFTSVHFPIICSEKINRQSFFAKQIWYCRIVKCKSNSYW